MQYQTITVRNREGSFEVDKTLGCLDIAHTLYHMTKTHSIALCLGVTTFGGHSTVSS